MSQENVEIVRKLYEAWKAEDMDALRDLYDPGVRLQPGKGWHEPRPYEGRDEVIRLLARVREAWKSDVAEPISFTDAGDQVVMRYIWRDIGPGPAVNVEQAVVYKLRKRRVIYQEYFWAHAEALEAVGLSEQDAAD